MKEYKVVCYAICKNEIIHVDRWVKTYKDADQIVIIDTGSEDGCWERLQELAKEYPNLYVEQKIWKPMHFGNAKQYALDIARRLLPLPQDSIVYCCFDLDEFIEDNGIEKLRKEWESGYDVGGAIWTPLGQSARWAEKIHSDDPRGRWFRPVHEAYQVVVSEIFGKSKKEKHLSLRYVHEQDHTKPRHSLYYDLLKADCDKELPNRISLFFMYEELVAYNKYKEAEYYLNRLDEAATTNAHLYPKPPQGLTNCEDSYDNWETAVARYYRHIRVAESEEEKKRYRQRVYDEIFIRGDTFWTPFYLESIYPDMSLEQKINILWKLISLNDFYQPPDIWDKKECYTRLACEYWAIGDQIKSFMCAAKAFNEDPADPLCVRNLQNTIPQDWTIQNIKYQ